VQFVLDSPVPADVDRDDGRGAAPGGHAGDAERCDVRFWVAAQVGDVPFDQERLRGMREDAGRGGQDLDGADLVAAMPAIFHHVVDRDRGPWKRVQGIKQAGHEALLGIIATPEAQKFLVMGPILVEGFGWGLYQVGREEMFGPYEETLKELKII
jgi:hypothetical protein